ncbi:type I methionyl aminopeptidase [Paenibacillus donghaensis]|uniref:type I methionyl aminopeptidase n=1 Tax=Paenibacillus donghaensis TaxID=414771 RepID=UPI001883BD38|nr:type I methionyl aminopeptidase [Paenibacillus donghaensis]MBE9917352.1 type I methionyl aminopeptidase [Paenibacillus donghaensis]
MEICLKSKEEIGYMREAGRILAACHREISRMIQPGVTPLAIDAFVEEYLARHGATPEQKGYRGFPFAICSSVNDTVCHGFPTDTPLKEGDVVTIDMVVNKDGWLADSGWSYGVGAIGKPLQKLLLRTEQALYEGITQAQVGNTIGDIGYVLEKAAKRGRYGIVKPLVGHGIGKRIHEPPEVPNFGRRGEGVRLAEGMVITIEPIFTLGSTGAVLWNDDGWSIQTADGSCGVQFEHTIAITKEGPVILTE